MDAKATIQPTIQITGAVRVIVTIALCLSTFIFVLDYTIANVAIPYIAGGLATGIEQGTYVITFFAVGNGVVLPMAGWLTKRFGLIATIVMAVFWFTVFSMACGLAQNLTQLVIFRFLQGAAAGPLVPVSQTILTLIYPRRMLDSLMALFSMVVLVAPVFGPILGGYFCVYYNWRWIFLINLPFGIFCTTALWWVLKPLNKKDLSQKADFLSFALLLLGMFSLQMMLDKGEQWNWLESGKIQLCFIGTVLGFSYLILWSLIKKDALIDLKLFLVRRFAVSTILIFTLYAIYMGIMVVIPIWLQTQMGYNAWKAGLAVAPIGLGAIITSPIVGRLIPKIGRLTPMLLGIFVMGISVYYTRLFYTEISFYHIGMSRFILGLGIGLWIVPMMGLPVESLQNHELSKGLGVFHFVRGVSGGIGTSVFTTIYTRRLIHQHHNLIENFNEFRSVSREYMSQIEGLGIHGERATAVLNRLLDQQASAIALDEGFMLMIWLLLAASGVVLLAIQKKKENPEKSASSQHISIE